MSQNQNPTWPGETLFAVTKSDSTLFATAVRQLYIGTGGDVNVVTWDGVTVLFKNTASGSTIGPFYIKQVKSTSTTASDIVAFV